MSNSLTLSEVVPVLNDLQTKLAGQNGDQVFEALKKILRGEQPAGTALNLKSLIFLGHYDCVNSDITEARFPMPKDFVLGSEPKLFHLDRTISSENAIREMEKEGYRPATIWDLLDFGAKNPEEQRKFPIAALGSVTGFRGNRSLPCLNGSDLERKLSLLWSGGGYNAYFRFLGVRK